ncbi:hypothetical protein VSO52_23065 [Pseudomonas fulva]|nr:hypothetical protein [Pseudomonas fulva]MEC4025635.1 hypothetical protein [Pseudomonas fulva]
MKKAIQQDTLEALVSDSALRELRAVRVEGGWSLQGRLGASWRPIRSRREAVRVWRSLTALERFCVGVGIKQLTVEL